MGGLVLGGKNNYPGAELYIDRRDITHWTDPAKRNGAPDYLQTSFRMAEEVVRLYPRLQAIDGEREIMRGVSIVDARRAGTRRPYRRAGREMAGRA